MKTSDLYMNPDIEAPCYVHAKVLNVEVEKYGDIPKVSIEMRVAPEQPQLSGRYLYAIFQPTPLCEYSRLRFRKAFNIENDAYEQAVGQWAAVRLMPVEIKGTKLSNVQFVSQTPISRAKSDEFARLEACGEMPPWD